MAKSVDFKIKVDGKQLNLTKISFKDFNKIITDAKKSLKELPLTDPRYKQLTADIKTAEKAWKEATKSAAEFNDENKEGAEDIATYKQQIRETTNDLQKAEQQFGKNSDEAAKLRERLKELRDEQDDFNETTRKLDDSLAAIPGPIGAIGQSMQSLGNITNSAKSAFGSLSKQFPILDNAWKATGIGLLIGLILGLVAAVVKAAQSFKPLQDAFAGLQDAFGSIMSALKPFTDFILNVVVGAMNLLAGAITYVAEAFGGVGNGAAKATLDLEREIAKQERTIGRLGDSLGTYTKNIIDAFNEEQKQLLEVSQALKDKNITDEQALDQRILIQLNYLAKLKNLEDEYSKSRAEKMGEVGNMQQKADATLIQNARKSALELQRIDESYSLYQITNEIISYQNREKALKENLAAIEKINIENKENVVNALKSSIEEQQFLIENSREKFKAIETQNNNERIKLQNEFNREDKRLINERANEIQQLTTQLIKEENARNLQAAKDGVEALKEQQRIELEDASLAGVTLKNLKVKQAAELLVANEQVRKAQLQFDAFVIQQEIDKQQRLVTEAGIGTQEYFDARRSIIDSEFEKEILLADGNQNEIENARTKHWKAILELDKEGLQAQINQIQLEYDGLYEGTVQFFDKQRQLEIKAYKLRQKELQGNYEALEALNKQHQKNMNLIDAAQLQSSADIQMRKFAALGTMNQEFFDVQRRGEEDFYEAEKKRAGDNNALLEVIELEHIKRSAEIDAQQKEAKLQVFAEIARITSEFGSMLSDIANQQLQAAQGTDKARFESAKKFAKAAIIVERLGAIGQIVANTGIANSKAVGASPLTFGQPWVTINTVAAGVSIAGVIAAAVKSINQIDGQKFEPKGGGTGLVRGMAKGGMIDGKRHSEGGVIIEAEGGEAVMTRGAVSMFGPLLSMMNQAGGGTNFNKDMMTTANDAPLTKNGSEQAPMVLKTYIVSNELTTEVEKQARLKNLSTL
jgi:hypothetical protein